MARDSYAIAPLIEAAESKCGRQQCEDAIDLLEQAVRIQPGNPRLYYQLGVCYTGGCRSHRLTTPDLGEEYLRHALSLLGRSAKTILRASILNALGNALGSCRRGSKSVRLREAIACHEEAAEIYRSNNLLEEWAREEFNLANAWCELPEEEFPEKWAESIGDYRKALEVRTRAKDPQRHAATLLNLGTAFRQLPSGDRTANVMEAVRCYRKALRIYTLSAFPLQYAELCNNLGNACLSCPAQDEASQKRHARDALRHFECALKVWTSEEQPSRYSLAQYNRGCAYLRLSPSPENLKRAVACFFQVCACGRSPEQAEIAGLARAQMEKTRSKIQEWIGGMDQVDRRQA